MDIRRVWAPFAKTVELVTAEGRTRMRGYAGGWWYADLDSDLASADYAFSVDGGKPLPDPRSPFQPGGVFGFSRPVDHSRFQWSDYSWCQRPVGIIYECHIGTFTGPGTFESVIERLEYLKDLGVTHLELMPIAEFPGAHGWGYDGVDLYAPHHSYGGPNGMKRLVDRCHRVGLGVILDVVYNHLGPSGNFLQSFGPYLTDRYKTPWGAAINLDGEHSNEVRRFFCDNALMWLRDYHVDGLRLDAVHAIFDSSAIHFLEQLAGEVRALAEHVGRSLFVIAESGLNDPRLVSATEAGGYGLDGQWSDDFHHAIHACLTGERTGYYQDFGSLAHVAKALTKPYVYDGIFSRFRKRVYGRATNQLPANRFVVCIQNHDQIGNRAKGDRLTDLLSVEQLKIASALLLCSPFVPLLFEGEEWGASTPFQYFEDHEEPELIEAIREGRRREFAHFFHDITKVPDPHARETFIRSKLRWSEREGGEHARIASWYKSLIAIRRNEPDLTNPNLDQVSANFDESARWLLLGRGSVQLACNLGDGAYAVPIGQATDRCRVLLSSDDKAAMSHNSIELPPKSVVIVRSHPD